MPTAIAYFLFNVAKTKKELFNVYRPHTKYGEGNVFSLYVCPQGVGAWSGAKSGFRSGSEVWWGGGPLVPGPGVGGPLVPGLGEKKLAGARAVHLLRSCMRTFL